MDESKRHAAKFLEKEIKTYRALSLFLSKRGVPDKVRLGRKSLLVSPSFYQERIREATKLVIELRKSN